MAALAQFAVVEIDVTEVWMLMDDKVNKNGDCIRARCSRSAENVSGHDCPSFFHPGKARPSAAKKHFTRDLHFPKRLLPTSHCPLVISK